MFDLLRIDESRDSGELVILAWDSSDVIVLPNSCMKSCENANPVPLMLASVLLFVRFFFLLIH